MKKNHIMKVMGDVSPKISANTLYCFPGENICSLLPFYSQHHHLPPGWNWESCFMFLSLRLSSVKWAYFFLSELLITLWGAECWISAYLGGRLLEERNDSFLICVLLFSPPDSQQASIEASGTPGCMMLQEICKDSQRHPGQALGS